MENTDLTIVQQDGINNYGLSVEQVQSLNYGHHTLEAIDRLLFDNENLTVQEAFPEVVGYTRSQLEGRLNYNLNEQEVQSANFGRHSLNAIDHLRQINPTGFPTNRSAFNLIQNLDEIQVNGVLYYDLTRAQVQTPNFNEQTLETIDNLMQTDRRRFPNPGVAFHEINGLNQVQIEGIRDYRLNRAQVQTPNFGEHTLNAMYHIMQNNNTTVNAAFSAVQGLTDVQTNALVNFNLRGRHVLDNRLTENTLLTIQRLNQQYPDAQNADLADIVMNQLLEYQVRGLELGLSAENLGFQIEGNLLVNLENDTNPGRLVDLVSILRQSESMTIQEAFQKAQALNTEQSLAVLNLGLRLNQVQDPAFMGNETIATFYTAIENNEKPDELEIYLNPQQQEIARVLMDEKIAIAQQQEAFSEQNVAAIATSNTNEESAATITSQDLSAFTVAMAVSETESQPATSKKNTISSKNTGKKKGGQKF
jgi:hypothetical protein